MRSIDAIASSFQLVQGKLILLMGRPSLPEDIAKDIKEAKKQIRQHQQKFPNQKWVTANIEKRLGLIASEFAGLKSDLLEHKKQYPDVTSQEMRTQILGPLLDVLDLLTKEATTLESIYQVEQNMAALRAVSPDQAAKTASTLKLDDINTVTFLDIRDNKSAIKMKKFRQVGVARGGYSQVTLCNVIQADVAHFGWMKVAYKELRATKIENLPQIQQSERMDKRLEREKGAWEALCHPNIAPLLGFVMNPHWGLVSPWYENGHILDYVYKNPNANILRMIGKISDAVAYLHERDLIHGDLRSVRASSRKLITIKAHKCSYQQPNIMVDDNGEPIVIDFGNTVTAITVAENGVSVSVVPEVIRWMAPERVGCDEHRKSRNLKPTLASDTYSFGCLCIEVITRSNPFAHWPDDTDLYHAREKHYNEPEVDPVLLPAERDTCSDLNPSDPLWTILEDCWKQIPQERPSMRATEKRLTALLNSSPSV
ncbi:hypothetical protein FRC02_011025 [Tulasnella sp. 418]|nr:hypothetical protein FRC02_011025 [Tulasnella sp. 418]